MKELIEISIKGALGTAAPATAFAFSLARSGNSMVASAASDVEQCFRIASLATSICVGILTAIVLVKKLKAKRKNENE